MRMMLLAAVLLLAQTPEFEAASIKPNVTGGPIVFMGRKSPGTFSAENETLRNLIQEAYGLPSEQGIDRPYRAAPKQGTPVLGGPAWLASERFDITAKFRTESQAEMGLMLRALLGQRFQLKLHRETRDLPVYELTAAKGGFKLPRGSCTVFDPNKAPPPLPNYCGSSRIGRRGLDWALDGTGMSMADLSGTLSLLIGGRTVIDKTGYTGTFDAHLQWTPGLGEPGEFDAPAPADGAIGPSIFSVLREQLGLRLKAATGPVDVLVIDHVERPSAN
jgi:uncharacterized protein (TIGR03435 family)